jgi:hypothetical protein
MRLSIYHTWEFIVPMPKLDSSGRNFNGGGNYNGRCNVCGNKIRAGEEIEWTKAEGAAHLACAQGASKEVYKHNGPTYDLCGGSGYGCQGWTRGEVIRANAKRREKDPSCPEWLYIMTAKRSYIREDGLSFGVGNDSGYYYTATARAATEAEYASAAEQYAKAETARAQAKVRAEAIKEIEAMCRAGERVGDENSPIPSGTQIIAREGVQGSGREIIVLGEDNVSWWCSGYYDDYRRSLYVTRESRALEVTRSLLSSVGC